MGLNVLGICETKWPDQWDSWNNSYRVLYSGGKGRNKVVLILEKKCVKGVYQYNERIIMVNIETDMMDTVILEIYICPPYNMTKS